MGLRHGCFPFGYLEDSLQHGILKNTRPQLCGALHAVQQLYHHARSDHFQSLRSVLLKRMISRAAWIYACVRASPNVSLVLCTCLAQEADICFGKYTLYSLFVLL